MSNLNSNDWNTVVSLPAGSGMSFLINQMKLEQVGGTVTVMDIGLSSAKFIRMGSNTVTAKAKKTVTPYYRQFVKRKPS